MYALYESATPSVVAVEETSPPASASLQEASLAAPQRTPTAIWFVTVLSQERLPWIALSNVQHSLQAAWLITPEWRVGHYLLMPSVLHFFCAPCQAGAPFDAWMRAWQRRFVQRAASSAWRWQSDHWDCRLGPEECYGGRWEFLRHHPVREGIVSAPEEWPHQGRLHDLLSATGSNNP